jgi:hypothetical protein
MKHIFYTSLKYQTYSHENGLEILREIGCKMRFMEQGKFTDSTSNCSTHNSLSPINLACSIAPCLQKARYCHLTEMMQFSC